MSEATQRLIPACFVAVILHGVVLSWQMHQGQVTLPIPLAVQRITVSLGTRPVAKEPPPEPEQEQKAEKRKWLFRNLNQSPSLLNLARLQNKWFNLSPSLNRFRNKKSSPLLFRQPLPGKLKSYLKKLHLYLFILRLELKALRQILPPCYPTSVSALPDQSTAEIPSLARRRGMEGLFTGGSC